ncbi:MFS transporter [Paenibacillus sp. GCM10027628]|uniref:MFS transporter n=1 Tax=Paenibacillus sp. GCM10027628 TaxID=3273413 RepID=UPI0036298B93
MKPLWTQSFITLTLSMFFLFTGFYLLVPTMPLFIKQLGGSESQVGVVMGLFTISAVVIRPFVGGLLDRMGRRQFVLGGLILFGLTMYSYSWVSSMFLLLALRLVHGVSWAMATTSIGTAVTDTIPETRRSEGISWFGMSTTLAMAVGPLIGVWMLQKQSFHGLFTLSTVLILIALVGAFLTKMPFQARPKAGRMVLFDKAILPVTSSIFFLAFAYGGVMTFLPLFAASIKVNSGTFFLVYAIALTIVRFISGRLADRFGEAAVIVPGFLLALAALTTLASSHGLVGVVAAAILLGFGFGSAQPALQAVTLRLVKPDQKGMANASFQTAFDLGIGIGTILLGLISQGFGYPTLFVACAVAGFISFIIYGAFSRQEKKAHRTGATLES